MLFRRNAVTHSSLCMNEAAHPIGKQHVDLARVDDRGYFTFAKIRMHHDLAPPIRASAIIWHAYLGGRRPSSPGFVRNVRVTYWTTHTRDFSCFADRGHDVPAFFTAGLAHLLNSIT